MVKLVFCDSSWFRVRVGQTLLILVALVVVASAVHGRIGTLNRDDQGLGPTF
jgi:hypothetical protein